VMISKSLFALLAMTSELSKYDILEIFNIANIMLLTFAHLYCCYSLYCLKISSCRCCQARYVFKSMDNKIDHRGTKISIFLNF
jgi:hypothetical protein